jgi:hypothetical protein
MRYFSSSPVLLTGTQVSLRRGGGGVSANVIWERYEKRNEKMAKFERKRLKEEDEIKIGVNR